MNFSVQQPTTLIKIKRVFTDSRELLKNNEKNISKGIDFYNIEIENDSQHDYGGLGATFTDICASFIEEQKVQDVPSHSIYDTDKGDVEPEILSKNILECNVMLEQPYDRSPEKILEIPDAGHEESSKDLLEIRSENFKNKDSFNTVDVSEDLEFIVSTLKFDIRVKDFKITQDFVLVYFLTKEDSLSFYKQYFKYLNLSFSTTCEWNAYFTLLEDVENEFQQLDSQETKISYDDSSIQNIKEFSRTRFNTRIEYFNQLKSNFSKNDLKSMSDDVENCQTKFIFKNTKELAVGSKSNKIMQDAIKIMSGDEIEIVFNNLEYDIVPISATKHGAYTIQTLLNHSTNNSHKKLISKYFSKEGQYLLAHEIGNYTFQKVLSFNPELAYDLFVSNITDIIESELGLKVFKRCSEFFTNKKEELLTITEEYADSKSHYFQQFKQIVKNM